ncbi:unnamed protein product [Vitrella brassicaformis CCMP3155]|uniref:Prokaryotic-type class I peptide chain release factors domain-containing protein n=1 Tax=Vitrella brassicaformis (strain CCMP3155) TaxID=1169540 RepID=A0A0G4EUW0_VITBC|nr:unnamed protein product [Vitrella brassicaformis CCMP3155]|eukprot:CEM02039.1 unnamed protein product [Vitrella brassicaformis CCMP3155]
MTQYDHIKRSVAQIDSDLQEGRVTRLTAEQKAQLALKDTIDELGSLVSKMEATKDLLELCWAESERGSGSENEPEAQDNSELIRVCEGDLRVLHLRVEEMKLETALRAEDLGNCFIEIQSGAGGTESMDWVEMLGDMYEGFGASQGWSVDTVHQVPGDMAGYHKLVLHMRHASGLPLPYLKGETGVHRLIRISPFDSGEKRHTSFAGVTVFPETPEAEAIVIRKDELKAETMRASGAGGQSVNCRATAVRLTHIPSGIAVHCRAFSGQIANYNAALQMIKAKLLAQQQEDKKKERTAIASQIAEVSFGRQIRTYTLDPSPFVKDGRTNVETTDAEGVLSGDALKELLEATLI